MTYVVATCTTVANTLWCKTQRYCRHTLLDLIRLICRMFLYFSLSFRFCVHKQLHYRVGPLEFLDKKVMAALL